MHRERTNREIIFEEFQPVWSRYLNVTETRTDGRTDRQTTCRSNRRTPFNTLLTAILLCYAHTRKTAKIIKVIN